MQKRTETEMLSDFLGGISTMVDASSQMVHQFQNMKFVGMRDMLMLIKDDTIKLIKTIR
jgi:hypothetical protein